MLQRLKILKKLEPYANLTNDQVDTMLTSNNISLEYFVLKYNFAMFVSKFEDENGSIVEFGEALSPSKKIETIFNQLLYYANESTKQFQPKEATVNPW